MKTILSLSLMLIAMFSLSGFAEPLFKYKDKTFNGEDLSPSEKQSYFDLETDTYRRKVEIIEEAVLKMYIEEQAAKTKKTKEQIEKELFSVKDPSDKEINAFYEENKARIPYPLDKIKGEIVRLMVSQKQAEAKKKLIDTLKKKENFQIVLKEPAAPVVDINTFDFPHKGTKGAKVKIVEFADFQCPHCKAATTVFHDLINKYKNKVEFVFMHFPINRSGISKLVAEGSVCATKQNKFWEYHDLAYQEQLNLKESSPAELAKKLNLNEADFQKCFGGDEPKQSVQKAKQEGERIGVNGTPTIYINGKRYLSSLTLKELSDAVDRAIKNGNS